MDAVELQLNAYLLVCAGVGSIFGSSGMPVAVGQFFHAPMYFQGLALVVIGAGVFAISTRAGR